MFLPVAVVTDVVIIAGVNIIPSNIFEIKSQTKLKVHLEYSAQF